MSEELKFEVKNNVGTIILDRPKFRNALSVPVISEFDKLLDKIEQDKSIRCLVIASSGEKSFIAGADINELLAYTPAEARYHIRVGHELFSRIEEIKIPTIASINGYCLGGGLEIAMACDIRVASSNAKFGLTEANVGMIPGWGGTQRLQRLIGQSRAKYYILTGEMFDTGAALNNGLVYKVYDNVDELREQTQVLGEKIASFAPITIEASKWMINESYNKDARDVALRDELTLAFMMTTHDSKEGLSAFLEKRKAQYKGN